MTHLYNAMPPFTHRKPGVIGAAAENEETRAELICDGIHIHPCVVKSTFKLFGAGRMILISDSMMATGMEDGEYALGGQPVIVKGNRALLKDGTIAGSATSLFGCMRTAIQMGVPKEEAVRAATRNPAEAVGLEEECGMLLAGRRGCHAVDGLRQGGGRCGDDGRDRRTGNVIKRYAGEFSGIFIGGRI